jgi:hypothetical protein
VLEFGEVHRGGHRFIHGGSFCGGKAGFLEELRYPEGTSQL